MRPRVPSKRLVTALGASLLLLAASAGTAGAARSELFTIDIDLDGGGGERFTSDSPLLCPSGEAFTDFHHGGGNFVVAGSFHLTKLIVCDDDSGSFVIRVNAGTNFVVGDGTTGGWSVVPGSGTGDYEGLRGGGNIVGINSDTPPIDLTDHYFGSLRT
jgi:hypothetical protein